jgi:hypothetical protein
MAKKTFKDESSFGCVCDGNEPGQFFLIGILHHMPDPISDLVSDVLDARRSPGRLDWNPVVSGEQFSYPSWFRCVAKDPAGSLYIGEDDGFIRHKNGTSKVFELRKSMKVEGMLQCVYARGIDDIVFGTYDGEIVHVQGDTVNIQKVGKSRFEHITTCFRAIHGIGSDFIVIVGDGGNVGRYRDGKWERVRSPSNLSLGGVWCKTEHEIYIAGNNGKAWRWDGEDRWEPIEFDYVPDHISLDVGSLVEFKGIIYAAGGRRGIYRLEGDRFLPVPKFKDEYVGRLAVTNIGIVGTGDVWGASGSWITLFDGEKWSSAQLKLTRKS